MKEEHLNTVLAVIIALAGVLTGYAAYKSAAIDSNSNDKFFEAQAYLADSNLRYAEQGQEALYDRLAYDKYLEYEEEGEEDGEIAKHLMEEMTTEAKESLKREAGPFDDAYYDALYKEPKRLEVEHNEAFDEAIHDSNRAVAYQLTALILAVALAFAGWASLAQGGTKARMVFGALSVLALISALIQMVTIVGPYAR